MLIRSIAVFILLATSLAAHSRGYRLTPSITQVQGDNQKTELYLTAANPAVIAEVNGIRFLASPRKDFFQNPWIGIYYIASVRRDMTEAMIVNANVARLYVDGKEVKRYTQAEQFAFLDKRKRSVDFWGGISSGLAAMNASRTAGRYNYSGTTSGTITDQYGNRANVEGSYRGTVVDQDEAQRAGTEAAINRSRHTYDKAQAIEGYMREVAEQSPEQCIVLPGDESEKYYWVFDLPKTKRGVTPARLEVDINGRHFIFAFDLFL